MLTAQRRARLTLAGQAGAVEGETVEGAEDGDGDLASLEIALGEGLEFFASDGFDPGEDFVERIEAAEIKFLAGEIGHAGAGGLEREHQRALEVILRAAKFFFRDRRFLQSAKFLNGEIDDLANRFRSGAGVDGHHSGVGIGRQHAEDSVRKALLFANVLEEARGHAAAKKIVEDGDGEAVFVAQWNRRNADAEMHLFEVALGFEMDGGARQRSAVAFGGTRGFHVAELLLNQFQHLLVSDVTGGGDHQMIRREPVPKARTQRIAIESFHGFRGAENRAAERMLRPETAGENLVKKIFGIVQIHLDLFEDDLALLLHIFGVEFRAEHEVGDDVKGDGQVLVKNLGIEADLFLGSEGVEHAADGIHFAGDGFGGAALRALKNHVLHEVGEAVLFGNFAAGGVADPDALRDGAHMGHGLGDNHQAVGQNVLLNVARLGRHIEIVTQAGPKGETEAIYRTKGCVYKHLQLL